MIQFRWITGRNKKPILQMRSLFCPSLIASGDIVLSVDNDAKWVDVPEFTYGDACFMDDKERREKWEKEHPGMELYS